MSARPLRIDLGRPAKWSVGGLALLAIGALICGWTAWVAWSRTTELAALRDRIDHELAAKRIAAQQTAADRITVPDKQATAVNEAIGRLNVPWHQLFAAVEALRTKEAALLSIEPNVQTGRLVIVAEARNPAAMLEMFGRAIESERFTGARLVQFEVTDQEAVEVIRYSVEAQWKALP
jgi:hypothetical protein